jgi:hypothetical protein
MTLLVSLPVLLVTVARRQTPKAEPAAVSNRRNSLI